MSVVMNLVGETSAEARECSVRGLVVYCGAGYVLRAGVDVDK